ncbi:anhydro-N-acetylmuramic acid kinase [Parasediminibacterium sp. JCM 36343]|uniref:anhydro-N-acetylmuramic acid kinase n=1 Tax=Parasediminibacterium sp. JCM 36343 TaxID=3374279 RepID=UPI003978FE93
MNPNISHLYSIAQKPQRIIIGLMSGTSLDGLDVAICRFKGAGMDTKMELLRFETVPYTETVTNAVRQVFSKKQVNLEQLCLLNGWIGTEHGNMVNTCLQKWGIANTSVDIIASHGQTIYHAPKRLHGLDMFGNGTLQIGDGDHIAVATGIITLSDFRQKHIAAGGEGAPLAIYGDYFLFGKKGENRVMLNIGGIANFTWLPASGDISEVFSTDIGPGNTLMDAYTREYFPGKLYDKDAAIALQGKVNEPLLAALKKDDFFKQPFPKSTGPELFSLAFIEQAKQAAGIVAISHYDMLATLIRFSADMIVDALQSKAASGKTVKVYASGGGIHNPLLMNDIQSQLPTFEFNDFNELGINPDAKEAVLFALLANEAIAGRNLNGKGTASMPMVSMGKISFPA